MVEKMLTDSIDDGPPNSHISSQRASLFVFEDTDAVIKMITKGRSPSIILRTHPVNLLWFFDSINLDLGIQIKYVNTHYQIADILHKGPLTQERWTQLRQLFIMMTPHMHSCRHSLVFSSVQRVKMSKRLPELVTEGASAKHRPVRFCCVYSHHTLSSSSISLNPMQNLVGRDSWRDASSGDSQNHEQKT